MKSSLVFFDTIENSNKGNLRGLVIFPIVMIFYYIFHYTGKKYGHIAAILFSIIIVSALGVHEPDTLKKAVVYGALVGFVIYGTYNCRTVFEDGDFKKSLIDVLIGVGTTAFSAFVLYMIVLKWPFLNYV